MKAVGWLAVGLTVVAGAAAPNLVVVHTDEHNFRTLGCYWQALPAEQGAIWGAEAVCETPYIDSLARRGVLCTSFYATSPVCTPSRAAMMSGMSPHAAGSPTNNLPLKDDVVTFAEVLRRGGYATAYVGKWHLDGSGKPQWAPERSFGWEDNRFMFNRGHWKKFEQTGGGPRVAVRRGGKPTYGVGGADEESFSTDWLMDRAIEFIGAERDEPFCVFVSLPDPHGPNTVRAPYDTMFDGVGFRDPPSMHREKDQVPGWGGGSVKRLNQNAMQDYLGMVKCIDDNVGKLLGALEEAEVLENTVVVFTSDHGDLMGEHARHNKGVPYETSAGVAFVVAGPGVAAGKVVGEALDMTDFGPTMLGLLSVEGKMEKATGRDASALLASGAAPEDWEDLVCLRATTGLGEAPKWAAAVSDRWKLVLSPGEEPWLFDLEKDWRELENVADAHPERVKAMVRALRAWFDRTGDPASQDDGWCAVYDGLTSL